MKGSKKEGRKERVIGWWEEEGSYLMSDEQ
jgi:hypothetical protein